MYLILKPHEDQYNSDIDKQNFSVSASTDMHKVSEFLKRLGVRVFKISSLIEIIEIKETYEEVPKEKE